MPRPDCVLSPTHPCAPEVTSTLFKCCQLKRRKQVQLHNAGSQRVKITLLLTLKHNRAWRGQEPFLGRGGAVIVKGALRMNGAPSKALALPHTNCPFVKRKPGKMGTGTSRSSGLWLSSILIQEWPLGTPISPSLFLGAGLHSGHLCPST